MTTATIETTCAGCSEMLSLASLTPWPATNELLCRFCLPARQEDEESEAWAQLDVRQALSTIGLDGVLQETRVWCRQQVGPEWTRREQVLAAAAAMLGEAAVLARELG